MTIGGDEDVDNTGGAGEGNGDGRFDVHGKGCGVEGRPRLDSDSVCDAVDSDWVDSTDCDGNGWSLLSKSCKTLTDSDVMV